MAIIITRIYKISLTIITLLAFVSSATYKRGCYYTNWSQYRPSPYKFYPENIDPFLCTHIFYAFARVNSTTLTVEANEINDEEMWSKVINLKTQNPALKVYLVAGGWNAASYDFNSIVSTDARITTFAKNIIILLRHWDFDGFDVDWEYPGVVERGSPVTDKQRFTAFLRIIREEFTKEATLIGKISLEIAATVSPSPIYADRAYEPSVIHQYVDFLNVMTYEIAGTWLPYVQHHSNSKPSIQLNSDWTYAQAVDYWIGNGVPTSKILIVLSSYGRNFKISSESQSNPAKSLGMGGANPVTITAGFLGYYEICNYITNNGWTSNWDAEHSISYASGVLGSSWNWVGYDTVTSFNEKLTFTKLMGLGGVSVWSLDYDDFQGTACGFGKYPLLNAVLQALPDPEPTTLPPTTQPETTNKPTTSETSQPTTQYATTPITTNSVSSSSQYKRGCYYTNWSQYRPNPYKFYPENIDPFLCTHIFYAFAKLNSVSLTMGIYESNDEEMWSKVINLKTQNPALKVYLVAGGWNAASYDFSSIVSTDARITTFAKNIIILLRHWDFDGFDVDWEYPGVVERGSPVTDKQRFTAFLRIIREEFTKDATSTGRPTLDLIATVSPSSYFADRAYEPTLINNYIDFLNVMSYDLAGTWLSTVQHHSALKQATSFSSDWDQVRSVDYWISKGFPANKIMLGLANYGRSFRISSGSQHSPGVPSLGVGGAGPVVNMQGFLAYFEICGFIKNNGWLSKWSDEQSVPYAYGQLFGNWNWVGYDTPTSFIQKVEFAKNRSLAGVFVWSLDFDDFVGTACGLGKYPLLNAISQALSGNVSTFTVVTSNPVNSKITDDAKTTTVPTTTTAGATFVPSCEANGFGSNPYDCNIFYQCAHGIVYQVRCAPGLVFDKQKIVCNWPNEVDGCD